MFAIILWGPAGGVLSATVAYPHGGLAMALAYTAGVVVSSIIIGRLTYSGHGNYGQDEIECKSASALSQGTSQHHHSIPRDGT